MNAPRPNNDPPSDLIIAFWVILFLIIGLNFGRSLL